MTDGYAGCDDDHVEGVLKVCSGQLDTYSCVAVRRTQMAAAFEERQLLLLFSVKMCYPLTPPRTT